VCAFAWKHNPPFKRIQTANLLLIDITLIFLILTTGVFLGVTLIWDGKRKQ
jgi:succinate dehydrogenase hydrophobic anchor subunit